MRVARVLGWPEGTTLGRSVGFPWTVAWVLDSLMRRTNETATCGFWVGYPWGTLPTH